MNKKAAVIDIGTNSVRLLLAEVDERQVRCQSQLLKTTRLGEGTRVSRGRLQEEPVKRTVQAVKHFYQICCDEGVNSLKIVATSAVREAENRDFFLELVYKKLGLEVQVLTGLEEACYSYRGAIKSLGDGYDGTVFIDVGGGSTEIVQEHKNEDSLWWRSFAVGAVNLEEEYLLGDPPMPGEIDRMKEHLFAVLEECAEAGKQELLVGTGGTITTLAAIQKGFDEYHPRLIHGASLHLNELREIFNKLVRSPLEQRKEIKGVPPDRADIIVPGVLIVVVLMKIFGAQTLVVSEGDLLAGALTQNQVIVI